MVSTTHAEKRVQQHAKLLTYRGRQLLAYLYRDENDALTIVMQLWFAPTDEQLRVSMSYPSMSDDVVGLMFEDLDDASVADTLDHLKIPDVLSGASIDG